MEKFSLSWHVILFCLDIDRICLIFSEQASINVKSLCRNKWLDYCFSENFLKSLKENFLLF